MPRVPLDEAVRSLARAGAAGEVFKRVLDALSDVAPRGAIFLTRQREVRGWSSFGYPPDATRALSRYSIGIGAGRLGQLMTETVPRVDRAPVGDPGFGQAPGGESLLTSLVVKGRSIAALLIERDHGQEPWDPVALGVLSQVAALRLELTLAQRKLETAQANPEPREAQDAPPPARVAPDKGVAEAPPADPGPSLELTAARRFARLVATDIRLYNEEAVALGRRNGDLVERLRPALERGKTSFVERHGSLGDAGLDLLLEAYVEVLAAGNADLVPASLVK